MASGGLALAATQLQYPKPVAAQPGARSSRRASAVVAAPSALAAAAGNLGPDGFTTLFVAWHGPATRLPAIDINVQAADGAWSGWLPLHRDHHVPPTAGTPLRFNPVLRSGRAFEYRTADPADLAFITVATLDASTATAGLLGAQTDEEEEPALIDGFIIPRAAWGANEDFRHEGQDPDNPIGWPPRYRQIERVVVHHTDTEFGWEDPAAVVRSIYYYHAVLLDWTDIGYNFLIDGYGNVYEGRYGGPGVIGGHALEYNPGSIGVALIGSYGAAWPPDAAQNALVRLIRARAPDIDPASAADWIDWGDVPNICGHGDVLSTLCPGADLQAILPSVRGQLAGSTPVSFPAPVRLYDPKIIAFQAGPSLLDPEGLIELRATITQAGREPLLSQGPEPGFVYDEGVDFDAAGYEKVEGRFRLAVDIVGADGVRNPYRWGFGAALDAGDEREIVGYIRAADIGTKRLAPSIVREYVRYYEDEELYDTVHVVHPHVSRASHLADADIYYFNETGHNVPLEFHAYWEAQGGLNRFGFPLTEAFDERSLTDGKLYLTQYFERARFEYHPELLEKGDAVKLGLLGSETTALRVDEAAFQPIEPFESNAEIWYFPETGHSTSYRFLETWIAQGGVETFGYPITEKFEEASLTDSAVRLVQYFERARFEYHPEDEWSKQIKLGHLGREILIERGWLPGAGVAD